MFVPSEFRKVSVFYSTLSTSISFSYRARLDWACGVAWNHFSTKRNHLRVQSLDAITSSDRGAVTARRSVRAKSSWVRRRGLENSFSQYRETAKAALAHITSADKGADISEAVRITPAETEEELRDLDDDEAMTRYALEILESQRNEAYEAALAELREDTQGWWEDTLKLKPNELEEDEEPTTPDVAGLRRFLEDKVLPWFEERKEEIGRRPLLREQAFGDSLDPDKLEHLGRYEVHLDRKLERMLSMLLRLRDLRQGAVAG